jgi:mannose-1-phosphate guanylyltransferase
VALKKVIDAFVTDICKLDLFTGTRFRPLSLDIPKPLFPVAGLPLIQHHIEACIALKELKEILLIGFYPAALIQQFVNDLQHRYNVTIRYLQEFTALGTAGGLYHFRDQIRYGNPDAFFVMNGDVCADFPLDELYQFHKKLNNPLVTIMGTEATRQQSLHYGCMVTNKNTHEVTHYVEKPSSYVSTLINCGIYVFSLDIFHTIGDVFSTKQQDCYRNGNSSREAGYIQLEQEILAPLTGTGKLFALQVTKWWSQLKTAGSAIYANRHYLELYRIKHPERLRQPNNSGEDCSIYPDVHIDPTAQIHNSAVIGPNVSIGSGVVIGPGVRIRESIILSDAVINDRSLILHSIIGRNSRIGTWARVEGTPSDPDPNKAFAKMENPPLFNNDGRLNPSITILGCSVSVPAETILLNSIVLPNKELSRSIKNEIIL